MKWLGATQVLCSAVATRQWPEVYDFVSHFFCMLHKSENTLPCMQFSHGRVLNVQKHATKSDTLGHCLKATLTWGLLLLGCCWQLSLGAVAIGDLDAAASCYSDNVSDSISCSDLDF